MNNHPYWYRLLVSWSKQGKTGLSLPFLIGAKTFINQAHAPSSGDIKNLLTEVLLFEPPSDSLRLKWCRNTFSYVFGITKADDNYEGLSFNKLFFCGDLLREFGDTQLDIIDGRLIAKYSQQVTNETYSIIRGEWQAYNNSDKKFITTSLNLFL